MCTFRQTNERANESPQTKTQKQVHRTLSLTSAHNKKLPNPHQHAHNMPLTKTINAHKRACNSTAVNMKKKLSTESK